MNKIAQVFVLCLALCGLTSAARAQEGAFPALIVAPMQGDLSQIQGWQPALGEGLADMLTTELSKIKKFELLESARLGVLVDEVNLGDAGYVGSAEKVDKGGFAGADFMFVGKVTRFGSKDTKVELGGFVPRNAGNLGVRQTTSDVQINWRLVDVATRRILKTSSAVADHKGTGFDVGANVGGRGGRIGLDNKEFMNSALGKATVKAIALIVNDVSTLSLPTSGRQKNKAIAAAAEQQVAATSTAATKPAETATGAVVPAAIDVRNSTGKVLAAPNKEAVIINLGRQHGFKSGDRLNLFELNEIKDDQGVVVFKDEKLAGEIVLKQVEDDRSKATYSGDLVVKQGWVVRGRP
jgi:curli biogenesis system outer membrane secretion channel CsgG